MTKATKIKTITVGAIIFVVLVFVMVYTLKQNKTQITGVLNGKNKFPIKIGSLKIDSIPSGNIYLEVGNSKFGYTHIIEQHGKKLESANVSVVDFAKFVVQNFTAIYFDKGEYVLTYDRLDKKSNTIAIVALKKQKGKNYFTVITEGWKNKGYFKNKNPL